MNTKNFSKAIQLVAAARTDISAFLDMPPGTFDTMEYLENVEQALEQALNLLDPKEEVK